MTRYPIPNEALDDRLAFVGTSGSGKTYAAKGRVESLLHKRHRVVIVDPLDVWFGLRLGVDGKTSRGFDVAILGGRHADMPLTEHSGALIGEAVARSPDSCIVSLNGLKTSAARQRFMLAFLDALYERTDPDARDPYHVVFDEADLWAPQKPMGAEATLCHLMEEIVRRGRVKGFIPWLITQRPAVLNKNVLSQVDGLIAFSLTSSQDRDALEGWIEGQADKQQWKDMRAELPTLHRGSGIVWIPRRGILSTVTFPENATFDSSRTPKRGEKKRSTTLKPLDLAGLREKLSTVEAEVKRNDPAALRAEVARLTKELAEKPRTATDQNAVAAAEERGFERGKAEVAAAADQRIREGRIAITLAFSARVKDLADLLTAELREAKGEKPAIAKSVPFVPAKPAAIQRQALASAPAPQRRPTAPAGGNGTLPGPEQRIVDAIRWWNTLGIRNPSQVQVGFMAGYSHKSGTWSTYLSKLRSSGMIEGRGDLVLTEDGLAASRAPGTPPNGEGLRAVVMEKIDGPLRRILTPILESYPSGMTQTDAGEASGYSPSSGTWSTYLSKLRSLELIEGRGELKAQGWLFP